MARQVLPWVGMAVGAYFGNPQLGFMIGSMVGNAVDPQVIKGPALGEGQNNSASEGGYRPIVLGKGAVGVCMIHEGPIKKRTIRTRQSKGGGPVTEEERAYRTMAFALGESAYPDTGVVLLRLWIDNKLRYDVTPTSQIGAESTEFADEFTFYPGNNTQLPDPDLEAFLGAGNVPSYRGGAPYIVMPDWDVTSSQGRAPMIKAELAAETVSVGGFGDEVTSTATIPGDPAVACLFMNTDGRPGYLSGSSSVSTTTGSFSVATLSPMLALESISNYSPSGVPYLSTIQPQGMSANGHTIYRADASGFPVSGAGILVNGEYIGNLLPSDVGSSWWWNFEDNTQYAEHGGLVWFGDGSGGAGSVYIGVRRTGGGLTYIRRLIKFPLSGEPPISESAMVTSAGSSEVPYFWMTRSAQGHVFLLSADGTLTKYDEDLTVLSTQSTGVSTEDVAGIGVDNEYFVVIRREFEGKLEVYGLADFSHVKTIPFTLGFGPYPCRVMFTDSACYFQVGLSAYRIDYTRHATEPVDAVLMDIAAWIHDRVNIPPGKYNVSELTDPVEGVVFADGYTGADAMRAAMGWYQFDAGEFDAGSGYRINYIKRGGSAEATLTDADIVEGPEEWEREDSYERPRVLHIAYQNPIADYGAPVIPIKRTSHDVRVVGERSVSIPFVTSDQNEVARRGDVALTVVYTEIAGTVEVILPISWLALAPTNTIGYSIRDRVRRLRMTDWKFSPDGTIKTEWIADRQSAFTSNLTALPAVPTTPPPPSIAGPTVSAVLDIPALADSMDSLHLYAAATGLTEGWWGASHQRKLPWDTDYTTATTFTRPATIIGTLSDAVTDASEHFTDTTNVVRVTLYQDDELQTFTQQQFLSENGAFALSWEDGGTRRWEVMQYRDAVKVGERVWELTTLARGRLNTETAEHPAGSLLVILDSSVRAMPMQSAWIGEDITHRAVSNGQLPDQAVPYTEEYTGESQREWPVASIEAELEGDTLNVSYVPRHRFGTDDHPVRSVNWDGYRVTATDGANTETVDTLSDFHTFDVTGWTTPITVSVSQLNRFTGAGPAVTEEVP